MSQPQGGGLPRSRRAKWLALFLLGVFVVVAGIRAPHVLSRPIKPSTKSLPKAGDWKKNGYTRPALPEAPDAGSMLLRLGVGTVVVLVLCVVVLLVGKRWLAPLSPTKSGNQQMTLVESLTLENRCRLHLVKVGEREILIGIDGSGVKTVTPLEEPLGDPFSEIPDAPGETEGSFGDVRQGDGENREAEMPGGFA